MKCPPWKLTCPLKRDYFSREYIFQPLIFRGHVSFQGSNCWKWFDHQPKDMIIWKDPQPPPTPPRSCSDMNFLLSALPLQVAGSWKILKYQLCHTVDGWNAAPVDRFVYPHYLQGFRHTRWCRISSINSIIYLGELYVSYHISLNSSKSFVLWNECPKLGTGSQANIDT